MTAALLSGTAVFVRGPSTAARRSGPVRCALTSERRPSSLPGIVHLLSEYGFDGDAARALCDGHRHVALLRPDSLRRRLDLLRSAGLEAADLPGTVAGLPELLTSEKMARLMEFLAGELGGKIDPVKLERLLATAPAAELAELPDKVRVLAEHGVPQERLAEVVNGVNIRKALCGRTAEELEEAVALLKNVGEDLVLRRPALLNLDPAEQLIPRLEFLTELAGGDEGEAARLVRKLPGLLAYTAEHVMEHVIYWETVGLSREQVFKVAMVYPGMFSASRERKLAKRVEFLRSCGLEDREEVFKFLIKAPLFLSLSEDNLGKKLAFLVKLGHRPGTKEMAAAVGAVTRTSCVNLQGAVGVLFGYGLGADGVLAMSRRHPQVLQYRGEALKAKLEYLVRDMDRDVDELLAFPAFLGYKLDGRIKPRYEAKKDVRGKGLSLNKLLSVSAQRFQQEP